MSNKKLKSGYTTGTHATAVLVAALNELVHGEEKNSIEVTLPDDKTATIEVKRVGKFHYETIKGDNDDIDVTKGAKISLQLLNTPPKALKPQKPSTITIGSSTLFLYAGDGVGVVTKKGLKITPKHPAINPTPLLMMQKNSMDLLKNKNLQLHAVVSVENGEEIAKQTANAKVGVIGGISILGTKGIVKPVSATAYLESIKTELGVAAEENPDIIVFTLGNTAYDFAKKHFHESSIIEIGNFVYDALTLLKPYSFQKLIFITASAKMTKITQGFKNTHNRYGSIDFEQVKYLLKTKLGIDLKDQEFVTLKAVLETLDEKRKNLFIEFITQEAALQLKSWATTLELSLHKIETITLPYNIKKELFW